MVIAVDVDGTILDWPDGGWQGTEAGCGYRCPGWAGIGFGEGQGLEKETKLMEHGEKTVGAVMVVGGGIGGMQASLDLAESGYKVYLVEKSPAIGGVMAQLDKTFPTLDCSMCILSPKLIECGRHPNIELVCGAELMEVGGEPGNFTAKVLKHPRYVDIDKCTGCGE